MSRGSVGLLAGIPVALACRRVVKSQLYGVAANDPITMGAAAMLIAVGMVASYLSARRAALLDPLAALREE